MEANTDSIAGLRSYIIDYVVGILWLLSAAIGTGSPSWIDDLVALGKKASGAPEFVVSFLVVIIGIVLPYCVTVIVRQPTLDLMRKLLEVQRKLQAHDKQPNHSDPSTEFHKAAAARINNEIPWQGQFTLRMMQTYLQSKDAALASRVEKMQDDVLFRATAALPSALLIGSIVYRVVPFHPLALGIGATLLMFVAITRSVIREFGEVAQCQSIAIFLATKTPEAGGVQAQPSGL